MKRQWTKLTGLALAALAAPLALRKGEAREADFIVNVRDAALPQSEHDPVPEPKVRLPGDAAAVRASVWPVMREVAGKVAGS